MKSKWIAKGVEYYPQEDMVLLIRCPECGRENYAPTVAQGICVWCGFNGRELLKEKKNKKCKSCKHFCKGSNGRCSCNIHVRTYGVNPMDVACSEYKKRKK